jgi:hypothetical protein
MDPVLEESTNTLIDQLKSLPDIAMAEDLDFEVWGRNFCRLLVSV